MIEKRTTVSTSAATPTIAYERTSATVARPLRVDNDRAVPAHGNESRRLLFGD
jgi:hypothetical protein